MTKILIFPYFEKINVMTIIISILVFTKTSDLLYLIRISIVVTKMYFFPFVFISVSLHLYMICKDIIVFFSTVLFVNHRRKQTKRCSGNGIWIITN